MEQKQTPSYSTDDRRRIARAYRVLLKSIRSEYDANDLKQIREATRMATSAHIAQRRKVDGAPYILHPLEVARICAAEIGLGPTAIIGAILHDTVEDTSITLKDIRAKFGETMEMIVNGLTKLEKAFAGESYQAENFRKILLTITKDVRVVLIKLADRLHNLRTITGMPHDSQMKIAAETSFVYTPLAHRLGLYGIKTEYEDICMKIMEPEAYKDIARRLSETKDTRKRYIDGFIEPLANKLNGLPYKYEIYGRSKSIFSIYNKIKSKGMTFDQIYDLFAVRVVLDVEPSQEKLSCWSVYSVITDVYTPIPSRLKDWVNTPKSNGYESLHTTVIGPDGRFVEVQIRTTRMNEIAERGFAAHWKYKGINNTDSTFDLWLKRLRESLEDPERNALEYVNNVRSTMLFEEEVYVFTPKSDMRLLPKGATALDFAFDIHSDVGYHCLGVKVNNNQVPLSYVLRNGDIISVTTSPKQKPTEAWLRMVITGKAKARIKQAVNEEKRRIGELGKETLLRKLKNLNVDADNTTFEFLAKFFDVISPMELFYAIAQENIDLQKMKSLDVDERHFVLPKTESTAKTDASPKQNQTNETPTTSFKRPSGDRLLLVINGEDASQFNYALATCCNPLPGDSVFGYNSINGMRIHRTNCPNATNLLANYGYRLVKVEWRDAINQSFEAHLHITGIDGMGIVQRITNAISNELHVNMTSISINGRDGYFEGNITVTVNNSTQLERIIETLKKQDGIVKVIRDH